MLQTAAIGSDEQDDVSSTDHEVKNVGEKGVEEVGRLPEAAAWPVVCSRREFKAD
jgi:hypothetical protein